ncbi:hypothetical protein [Deinococcus pimensis]|uniref:hypothetical protein n=1 Tax=Deinococcus pimensis TaxID=309888 RepID=UPI0004BCC0DA|nr:hypothetical protein [Deinococcus pimensis]
MSNPAPHDAHEDAHEGQGAPPRGTLFVSAVVLTATLLMWFLVLGILQGRA